METLQFHGAHYDVPEVVVTPKPVQQPHPPIHVAATSPESVEVAARQGPTSSRPPISSPRAVLRDIATYRDGLARHGHDPATRELTLSIPVHVAPTTAQAQAQARDGFMDYFRVIGDVRTDYIAWLTGQGSGGSPPRATDGLRAPLRRGRHPDRPADCRRQAAPAARRAGAARILCWMNMGRIPHTPVLDSMERFAHEVLPPPPPAAPPDPTSDLSHMKTAS